jgi:DNA polymerase-4
VEVLAARCVQRLHAAGRSGRTVVLKVRRFDFSTLTRSETLRAPTDDEAVIAETARRLAMQVDVTGGVRLLGVGVSQLADFTQEDLFAQAAAEAQAAARAKAEAAAEADPEAGQAVGAELQEPEATGATGATGARAEEAGAAAGQQEAGPPAGRRWLPGQDVTHAEYGPGWVQGSGVGRVTVRFETPYSPPGRVRTFAIDDPELAPAEPLPLRREP